MITAAPTTQPDYFSRGLSCTADQITEMALAWGGKLYSTLPNFTDALLLNR